MSATTATTVTQSSTGAPPAATPSTITTCHNCATTNTPLWRRDESGSVLCNACGLFLKLHNKPRPIHLKTDTIKSRNRVKATPISSTSSNSSTTSTDSESNTASSIRKAKQPKKQRKSSTPVPPPVPTPPQEKIEKAPLLDQLTTAAASIDDYQYLKTRVAELEIVNDLFKTRMTQLEKDNEHLIKTIEQYKSMIDH